MLARLRGEELLHPLLENNKVLIHHQNQCHRSATTKFKVLKSNMEAANVRQTHPKTQEELEAHGKIGEIKKQHGEKNAMETDLRS